MKEGILEEWLLVRRQFLKVHGRHGETLHKRNGNKKENRENSSIIGLAEFSDQVEKRG